jgi:hypothetical protein
MDKNTILVEFKKLYMIMVKEGILSLEDYITESSEIPAFGPTMEAFVEGYSEKVCLEILDILAHQQPDEHIPFIKDLGKEFFVGSNEKFIFRENSNSLDEALSLIEQEIDEFIGEIKEKYHIE